MRALILFLATTFLNIHYCFGQQLQLAVNPMVVEPDELVIVEVRVDAAVSDLRGYTLDLHYDRYHASVFSIYEGEVMLAHTPTFFYWEDLGDNGSSVIHVDHAILGGTAGGSGPGVLFYLVLRGEDCGVGDLWVDNALFRDLDNVPMSVNLGSGVQYQVCQVPPLYITNLGNGIMQLTWDRVLNAQEYHLWTRERWGHSWQYLATTTDTSWVDPGTPFLGMRLYRLTLLHN